MNLTDPQVIASLIDHTILRPDATLSDVSQYSADALQYNFASVCVSPCYVPQVKSALAGSTVKVCTVIGFPHGNTASSVKFNEARRMLDEGADELDMVINVGWLKSGDVGYVRHEIETLTRLAHAGGALLKVIIETALLSDDEKRLMCTIARDARADFVKTSTGYTKGGATLPDVVLMRAVVGSNMGVKASGGIKDLSTLLAMINAGATRIGTSNGVPIMKEAIALAGNP